MQLSHVGEFKFCLERQNGSIHEVSGRAIDGQMVDILSDGKLMALMPRHTRVKLG
jgi:hypothetical protein